MKHKWHDEIVAWAGGAEIECFVASEWYGTDYPNWDENNEFRIKPQPKQPKYLYVINNWGSLRLSSTKELQLNEYCIGKIEVVNDE